MMSAKDREHALEVADDITPGEGITVYLLARGLLAEHGEVIAARAKIADMSHEATASALRFVEAERRHVADLAAARGVTARLRTAILEGATDEAQIEALSESLATLHGSVEHKAMAPYVAHAFIALFEEHKATSARLAAVLAGVERVIAEARGT